MALVIWEWNRWIKMAKGGDGELLAKGLLKAVRTHPQVRHKTSSTLMMQYGFDSADELAQEVAIKILADHVIMHSLDTRLDDAQIGRRINQVISNQLIDDLRRWTNKRALYENRAQNLPHDAAGRDQDIETFLEGRLADLGQSPEGQAIINELLERFYRRLTPRERMILNDHEKLLGQLTTEEMRRKLSVNKTTIYDEIKRIRKEFSLVLGGEFKT